MRACCAVIVVGLLAWLCCGCLQVEAPAEVSVGSRPPPKADCGPRPKTYNEAVAAWQRLCDRNAYLEQRNARLEDKYAKAKRDKEDYKNKYKKLKDRYED